MSTTITGLPNATTPLDGTERVPMDQAGATKDATTQDIANLAPATNLTYTAATRSLNSSTGADVTLPLATVTDAGLESAADKTKLDSITVDTATLIRIYVRNSSGVSIPKGSPVYQTGSSGTTVTVALADASAEATAAQTLGLAQETIANNANGYVVAVGLLDGVNTVTLTEGQIVWLSETTGQLTTTRPTQPAHGVVCGYCVKQSAGASGILYVKVDNGLELEELHDVLVTGATSGQVLYKAADGLWKPKLLDGTNLANTTVTAGSYNFASITVDAQGRLTAASSGSAPGTDLSYTAGTRLLASSTGADVTLPLVSSTDAGLAPASGGGTTNFLRADGTWAVAGGLPGGSTTQLQFNDAGVFNGDSGLTYNKTTNTLTVGVSNADPGTAIIKGDINLDDGGTYTTTLQTITPTANRTVSIPDATGTLALVAGSSGQLVYNNAGVYAGIPGSTVGASGNVTLNASSGFTGNLLDLQVGGTSRVNITGQSTPVLSGSGGLTITPAGALLGVGASNTISWYFTSNAFAAASNNSTIVFGATSDVVLARDAANTLAQRNGTNAQVFRLYNTYTSSTNYENLQFAWAGNVAQIGTSVGSAGGSARDVAFGTWNSAGSFSSYFTFGPSTSEIKFNTAFQILPGTPLQWRNGSDVRNKIEAPSDGTLTFKDWWSAGNMLMQIGGSTSSFPAIKRNTTALQVRLADDSGYTTIDAQHRLQGTAPATASSTGTAGDIRYDADYIYVCTATNTWKRAALATW